MEKPPHQRFNGIEVGRGVAALLVVFHHTCNIMDEPRFFGAHGWPSLAHNFNVGADFFFVLSGFIIAWIHWGDIGQPGKIRGFTRKRFLRLYPLYWIIVIPLAILYMLHPEAGRPHQHDPLNVLFSILLLPYPAPPILGVAWTLVHEIIIYALFGALIVLGRRFIWILPAWALAILAAQFAQLSFPASVLLSPFNLLFLMGFSAAVILKSVRVPAPRTLAIAGCALFAFFLFGAPHVQDNPLIGRLAFGIPSVAIVLGTAEWQRRYGVYAPRFLLTLGAASYAIYLVHPVALSASINLASRLATGWPLEWISLVVFALATLAGVVVHFAIEKPVGAFLRARFSAHNARGKGPVEDARLDVT